MKNPERTWFERIEKYPLWYRYAPEHIRTNLFIQTLFIYQKTYEDFPTEFPDIFDNGVDHSIDKRTRNEIGQEKHESRKCKECGK